MDSDRNKFSALACRVGREIKNTLLTKRVGFYVGLAACALTAAHTFVYINVPKELFNGTVIACSAVGVLLFILLSLFKKTSSLAPVALMVCDFLCITSLAVAEGSIDYFTTQFFDGFSLGKFFTLPVPVWFSIASFVISFVLSSVAMFLPQNKKKIKGAEPEESAAAAEVDAL